MKLPNKLNCTDAKRARFAYSKFQKQVNRNSWWAETQNYLFATKLSPVKEENKMLYTKNAFESVSPVFGLKRWDFLVEMV